MRRLISFLLLLVIFWGSWQLFLYQAKPQKEAVVTIGATLPLSGANAATGLAAQDALNLALKEWNNRQNRYKYRIFYLDDLGKAEQTQKNLLTLLEKQNAAAVITLWTPAAEKAIPLAGKFRRLHFTCAFGNNLSDGLYNFNHYLSYHADKFADNFFQATGKRPASCSSNLYDALSLLIFAYENTSPNRGGNQPSAERVSRSLHKIFNHTSASGQIRVAPNGTVLPAKESQ